MLLALLACHGAADARGVYRSSSNAWSPATLTGEVRVWGPDGTRTRLASPDPTRGTLLGESGPLWIVDRDVAAPGKAARVDAALVERAGFRMQELLGTTSTGAVDAAKAGGVYVRSLVKVRMSGGPPVYVVTATGDEVGAGKFGGPKDVRAGANCEAAVGLVDSKAERLLSGHRLEEATRVCAVPVTLPPVDLDGDGGKDVLVYGQNAGAGFRAWFTLAEQTLVAGTHEVAEGIPR